MGKNLYDWTVPTNAREVGILNSAPEKKPKQNIWNNLVQPKKKKKKKKKKEVVKANGESGLFASAKKTSTNGVVVFDDDDGKMNRKDAAGLIMGGGEGEEGTAEEEDEEHVAVTIVAVTHSLELIEDWDFVAFMDGGRVVELGAPEELLNSGGQFAAFHARAGAMDIDASGNIRVDPMALRRLCWIFNRFGDEVGWCAS